MRDRWSVVTYNNIPDYALPDHQRIPPYLKRCRPNRPEPAPCAALVAVDAPGAWGGVWGPRGAPMAMMWPGDVPRPRRTSRAAAGCQKRPNTSPFIKCTITAPPGTYPVMVGMMVGVFSASDDGLTLGGAYSRACRRSSRSWNRVCSAVNTAAPPRSGSPTR